MTRRPVWKMPSPPQGMINTLHIHCLQLVKQRLPGLDKGHLCRLADVLAPVTYRSLVDNLFDGYDALRRLPGGGFGSTDLGSFARRLVEDLPAEVQIMICQHMKGGLFASLAVCVETLDWLEQNGSVLATPKSQNHGPRALQPTGTPCKFLGANTGSVLGERYLTEIGLADDHTTYTHAIPILDGVLGVQYGLGMDGVRSLRLRYKDGTASPWLGDRIALESLKYVRSIQFSRSLRSLTWKSEVSCLFIPNASKSVSGF